MTIEARIKQLVNDAIPLDMTCEVKRKEQIALRARLRVDIELLFREHGKIVPFDPRQSLKA